MISSNFYRNTQNRIPGCSTNFVEGNWPWINKLSLLLILLEFSMTNQQLKKQIKIIQIFQILISMDNYVIEIFEKILLHSIIKS